MDPDPQDDAALVAAARAGDAAAFAALLKRHRSGVLRLCERLLGPGGDAQDAAQEAALQAFLGLDRLRDGGHFGAWLHGIAANVARRILRHRRVERLVEASDAVREPIVLWAAEPPSPEEEALDAEVRAAVRAAVAALPGAARAALLRHHVDGRSYAEVAAELGVPLSTVRGRLFEGRRRLRRALAALAPEVLTTTRTTTRGRDTVRGEPAKIEASILFVGRYPYEDRSVVMLREANGRRRLPVDVSNAEGQAVERAVRGDAPAEPATHDLALRLLAPLGARVARVRIDRVAGGPSYASVAVAGAGGEFAVEARAGDGLALAARAGAPIEVAAGLLAAEGFDPEDADAARARDRACVEAARRRLAERTGNPAPPPFRPPRLSHARRSQVRTALARLRVETGGRLALLAHASGALVAADGAADRAALRRLCRAKAARDAELVQLLMTELGGRAVASVALFADFGGVWRVELWLRAEPTAEAERRFWAGVDELKRLPGANEAAA